MYDWQSCTVCVCVSPAKCHVGDESVNERHQEDAVKTGLTNLKMDAFLHYVKVDVQYILN